ncbi:MAG: saccharopine dehydrogenase NADP-binding domain-containing protein, partial [Gaiellaceae bacterium]
IVVIGAGGAGAAVAHVALTLGAQRVTIVDLDDDRAATLAARLGAHFDPSRVEVAEGDQLADRLAASDGVIHATPTGMADHPGMPFSPDLLRRDLWVADVVYRPLETELLRQARELGCPTLDGGAMAVFQAVGSFRLFTGLEPDPARMLLHFDRAFRTAAEAAEPPPAPVPSS